MEELSEYLPPFRPCVTGQQTEGDQNKTSFQPCLCQPGLPWSALLEEIFPDPLAVVLPDGAGHRDHLLPAGSLLSQLPPGVAPRLPFLRHLHHLLLLESSQETISGDGLPQTRPGNRYTITALLSEPDTDMVLGHASLHKHNVLSRLLWI